MSSTQVNTVTGPIPVDQLGMTLMHEHVLIGMPGWQADSLRPGRSRDEIIPVAVDKIQSMQALGIQTMLDPCPNDLGRDVELSAELSARTGFNIICATGLYKEEEGGYAYWNFPRTVGFGDENTRRSCGGLQLRAVEPEELRTRCTPTKPMAAGTF